MFVPYPQIAGVVVAIGFALVVYDWAPALLAAVQSLAPAASPAAEPPLFAAAAGSPTSPAEAVILAMRACSRAKIAEAEGPLTTALEIVAKAHVARIVEAAKGGAVEPTQ